MGAGRQTYQVATPDGHHHSETSVVDQVSGETFRRRTTSTSSTDYTTHTHVIADGAQQLVEWWRFTEGGESSRVHSPPALVHPADLSTGATAASTSTVTTHTREVTVDGPEEVTVPAGTFTALRTTTVEEGASVVVQWWVPGRGRVKVVGYDVAAPASVTIRELVASSP